MSGGLNRIELERFKQFVEETKSDVVRKDRSAGAQRRTKPRVVSARHERAADRWVDWFHKSMREAETGDPATLLPSAFARLEQQIAARIIAELKPTRRKIAALERAAAVGSPITAWKLIRERYEAIPYTANGTAGPTLDLRPFLEQFMSDTGIGASP